VVRPSLIRTGAIVALAATVISVLIVQPVLGYTLQRNNFPDQPVGCTNVDPWWCIEWPLAPDGYSSTTHVYLYSTLNNHPSGETIDMKQQARNAFGRWNGVPAREPYLDEVTTIAASSGYQEYFCPTLIQRGSLPAGKGASTSDYTPNDLTGSGSNKRIVCSQMVVSSTIAFDADNDPTDGKPDARFVFTHEQGHILGLGHTWHVAVMYPVWPNDVYMGIQPTNDDILGLQVAYGAP
jgi:hypothetical protein